MPANVTNTKYVRYVMRIRTVTSGWRDAGRSSAETNARYSAKKRTSRSTKLPRFGDSHRETMTGVRDRENGRGTEPGKTEFVPGFREYWHTRNLLSASFPEIADLPTARYSLVRPSRLDPADPYVE